MSTTPATAGYVVFWRSHRYPQRLRMYGHLPKGGVLSTGPSGTLFKSRDDARAAIRRTLEWLGREGVKVGAWEYEIVRLQEAVS